MRLTALLLIAGAGLANAATWSIPSANQGYWTAGTQLGVDGGIDQYLAGGVNDRAVTGTVIDITQAPYNADDTGMADVYDAVTNALEQAESGDVIYFPAGTYLFATGDILLPHDKDGITIRGAGHSMTTFDISYSGPIFKCREPGGFTSTEQTVTGTKTKGTSTLSIANTTGFTLGRQVLVSYENEHDDTRIQAGAVPVAPNTDIPWVRAYVARISAVVANTSVTVDPPLVGDATSLALKVSVSSLDWLTKGWGFEGFSVTYDAADHSRSVIHLVSAEQCWVYDVHFLDWSKDTDSGSCISVFDSYKVEVRKCLFNAAVGSSSDGAIGIGTCTSALFIDNIFSGGWSYGVYDNGNSSNNGIAYNFLESGGTIFHNSHPSLNLIIGNVMSHHQSDGYHGSSSHNTIFRNWLRVFGAVLNRWKRYYVVAGNIIGVDGAVDGVISWGNPNIGNGDADGFAGPTGLSDQEGETDYSQPGYGNQGGSYNTYVIQAGDIFAGDFWEDWKVTGTLDTRTSDSIGVFTVSGGNWFTGASPTGAGNILASGFWTGSSLYVANGSVTSVAGSVVTINFASGTLPAEDTVLNLFFGPVGFQERDLDVQASSTTVENYFADAGGTGAVQGGTADTLPDCYIYASKPAFFFGLAWPPFDPNSYATADEERIPAGYRFNNAGADPPGEQVTAVTNAAPRLRGIRFR